LDREFWFGNDFIHRFVTLIDQIFVPCGPFLLLLPCRCRLIDQMAAAVTGECLV
jgi:hypothetical protein